MTEQMIDTEIIQSAANKIRETNDSLNKNFEEFTKIAKKLDGNWESEIGDNAISVMHKLITYGEERSNVFKNYINILEQQVNPGYENAESTNTSLADMFK